jgi:SAM-dependent methyltransferase
MRRLLSHIPVLSRIIKGIDTLAQDHLLLVQAYHELEAAYHDLVVNYRTLEQEHAKSRHNYATLHESFQRLTRPTLRSASSNQQDELVNANGIPVPTAILRYWVAGNDNLSWFLESGEQGALALVEVLQQRDIDLQKLKHVLDFGCGCGRVIRHLPSHMYTDAQFYGTDSNEVAIEWCRTHLSFAQFNTNTLEPPLQYSDDTFDIIYAFSVFTHFDEALQIAWINELRRVLKPGGYLVITVHGDFYFEHLNEDEKRTYKQGRLVVQHQDQLGENTCGAFHPERYVRDILAENFKVLSFMPEGARGNPRQDLYLLQAPSIIAASK